MINAIRLRWTARKIGFEKILLKNGKFIGFFISDQESSYFQSETFSKVLTYVQVHPSSSSLKESREKLALTLTGTGSVNRALVRLNEILE